MAQLMSLAMLMVLLVLLMLVVDDSAQDAVAPGAADVADRTDFAHAVCGAHEWKRDAWS
jgi:hypothetical protein